MDTREKITTLAEFGRREHDGDWMAVIGTFDPVTAKVTRMIHQFKKPQGQLLTVVVPGEVVLLNVEARAALMAALRDVNAVVIGESEEARSTLESLGIEVFEDAKEDWRRSQEFVECVLERRASAAREKRGK
jgi:hypothetical protein